MSHASVEIIVHIDEALTEDHLQQLEHSLSGNYGIEKVRINSARQHLMLVDYHPENVNTLQVLDYVKSKGVHAELVGGI